MKKRLIMMVTALIVLTNFAFAAELTLTDFAVSGSHITAKGIIDAPCSRASLFIEKDGSGVYVAQAEAETDGTFDLSFDTPAGFESGSYTAYFGGTDIDSPKSVSFSYPGDKVYVNYTPPEDGNNDGDGQKDGNIDFSAVKKVSRITVSGQVKEKSSSDNDVLLVVKKANASSDVQASDIAYMDQTTLDEDGKFSFEFIFVGSLSEYMAYLYADGKNISDSIEFAGSLNDYVTAELSLTQKINTAVLLANIKNTYENDVPYVMIIAMYDENNTMVGMKTMTGSAAGLAETADNMEHDIPSGTVKIKAMLWNSQEEMLPIAKPAALEY